MRGWFAGLRFRRQKRCWAEAHRYAKRGFDWGAEELTCGGVVSAAKKMLGMTSSNLIKGGGARADILRDTMESRTLGRGANAAFEAQR